MTTKQIPHGCRREECMWSHEVFLFKAGSAPSWSFSHSKRACSLDHFFILFYFITVLKTWRLCFSLFVLKTCLLLSVDTIWDFYCVTSTLVVFAFFIESSGVVTLSWFKAPSGFRFLYFCGGCRERRGGVFPIYIWPTKPKLSEEWTLLLTFTSQSLSNRSKEKKSK